MASSGAIFRFLACTVSEACRGRGHPPVTVDSSQFHDRRVAATGTLRLTLDPSSEAAADAAEAALRSIDLTKDFAPVVVSVVKRRVTNNAPDSYSARRVEDMTDHERPHPFGPSTKHRYAIAARRALRYLQKQCSEPVHDDG
jgi:hypothetical protein